MLYGRHFHSKNHFPPKWESLEISYDIEYPFNGSLPWAFLRTLVETSFESRVNKLRMDQAHVKHVYNEMKYAFRKADEAEKFLFHAVMMMGKRNRITSMKAPNFI